MRPRHDSYDVLVAGGGPAGSTTAALVAAEGFRVALLERSARPRFKVGESLMPATYWTFQRLGVLDRMRESRFPKKSSVQFFAGDGRSSSPFYFEDHDPHESSQTWQVVRSEFDQMLLDNAAEKDVEVVRGANLKEVLFEAGRAVGARVEVDGARREIASRVLVDATGQSALLGRRLRLKADDYQLRNASLFTHFEGALRDRGKDEGATLILHTRNRDSWFWYIPLPQNRVSVGVVGSLDYLIRGRSSDLQRLFDEELGRCPALSPRLEKARQVRPVRAIRDFSYRSRRVAGDGWVLAGDAFGFIDPIYSTGVFLALVSGEMAADSICEALAAGDPSGERLGRHGARLIEGMDALHRLVEAFYDRGFSFARFLQRHPDCRGQLVDLLIGNVYRRPVDRLMAALDGTTVAALLAESSSHS